MLWLFELTISYKPQVADARERKKKAKFYYLVEAGRAAGYQSELIETEMEKHILIPAHETFMSSFQGFKKAQSFSS